jgi:hypothetical protein
VSRAEARRHVLHRRASVERPADPAAEITEQVSASVDGTPSSSVSSTGTFPSRLTLRADIAVENHEVAFPTVIDRFPRQTSARAEPSV